MGVNMSKIMLSVGAGGAGALLIYSLWKFERPSRKSMTFHFNEHRILGLRNCGNSCFLNAILQALASCRYVLAWLREKDYNLNLNYTKPVEALTSYEGQRYPLVAAMLRAILVMNRDIEGDDCKFACQVPGDVLAGLRANGHSIGVHLEQDAYEVFLILVLALNQEVESSVHRNQTGTLSVLTDGRVFEEPPLPWSESEEVIPPVDLSVEGGEWAVIFDTGSFKINDRIYSKRQIPMETKLDYKSRVNLPCRALIVTQMQCMVCMTKTKARIEPCDILTLNLPPPDPSLPLSIHELLLRYMRPTLVHKVDCETCTRNHLGGLAFLPGHKKVQTSYFKYNFIGKLPKTLCIHIPRSSWGRRGLVKRGEFVSFPDRINLGMLKRFYDKNPKKQDFNAYRVFKQEPDHECNMRRFRNSEYGLMAVISHVGSVGDSGHFVTFRKVIHKDNPSYANWYYVSDEVVQEVPPTAVMSTRAYMLFYEKRMGH